MSVVRDKALLDKERDAKIRINVTGSFSLVSGTANMTDAGTDMI